MADAGDHLPSRQGPDLRVAAGSREAGGRRVFTQDVPSTVHPAGHHSTRVLSRRAAETGERRQRICGNAVIDVNWLMLSLIPSGAGYVLFTYGRKMSRFP